MAEAKPPTSTTTNPLAPDQGYQDESVPGVNALQVQERYGEERAKRLRDDGNEQFVDVSLVDDYQSFLDDPWVDNAAIKPAKSLFPNSRCHMLILGGGWGGLLYAIRMVQSGVRPEDIRIVDTAGGFGGTWYWNRYPGLFCDIESYCYLPLLEETGYVPKHRYSYGEEIRKYAELVANKWGITDSAVLQTRAKRLAWNEELKEWQVDLVQHRKEKEPETLNIRASFVATVNGALNWPKLPGIAGILDYASDIFHSSRWNYAVTGGSPSDPSLTKLQDKRVAIIGTGATAVQIVPHLARWAKHLYIIQRTPSGVDTRDQCETDPTWFRSEVASMPGWQRERMKNFHQHFTTEQQPAVNLVSDQWTTAVTMVAVSGNPNGPKTMEELPAYLEKLNAIDLPRQDRIRKRIDQEVKDSTVAEKLKAWYPTWCKRPAFHDDYLATFNRKNVTLVDTDGKGPDRITTDSIIISEQIYPVDLIICATGFRAPFSGSPAQKANIDIIGRDGISMAEEWARNGPSTQHGAMDANFPNLFLSGPWQASLSPNNLFNVDVQAQLAAHILSEATSKADGKPFAVAPTAAAAENWGMQILMRSIPNAAIMGCTPGYFNVEGGLDRAPPEMQMVMAKAGLWGHGIEDFVQVTEAWRKEGKLEGIEIRI